MLREVQLSDDLNDVLADLNRFLANVVPCEKEDGEDKHDKVVNDTPCYPEGVALGVLNAMITSHSLI